MDDGLDVVTIRVENERSVVARMVFETYTRRAEILAASLERRPVELDDLLPRPRRGSA